MNRNEIRNEVEDAIDRNMYEGDDYSTVCDKTADAAIDVVLRWLISEAEADFCDDPESSAVEWLEAKKGEKS